MAMKFDPLFSWANEGEYNDRRAAWRAMDDADRTFALGSQIRELGAKLDALGQNATAQNAALDVIAQLVGYKPAASDEAASVAASDTASDEAASETASDEAAGPVVELAYPGEPEAPHVVGDRRADVVS